MRRDQGALSERVRRFTLAYLELLGGEIEEVSPDLYRVELTPEQAAEIDPSTPVWLWQQGRSGTRSQLAYYFTFTPSVAERVAEAELVSAGSHRLHQLIEAVRRIGQTARLWVPLPPARGEGRAVAYRPFYYLLLRLEYRVPGGGARLFPVAVDRVDHLPLRQLASLLPSLPLRAGIPGAPHPMEEGSLSLEAAFALAFGEALEALSHEEPTWAQEAAEAVRRERERLIEYYAEKEREGEAVEPERTHRLDELEALAPRVLARLQIAAEVYLPVATEQGRLRHLAFAHSADSPARRR